MKNSATKSSGATSLVVSEHKYAV